jgi:phosphatidylserine/phosphatidylglycerophosphate/cardiolipin synthase-like enzyme
MGNLTHARRSGANPAPIPMFRLYLTERSLPMRHRDHHDGLTVNAIAGAYVVFFGLDLAEGKRAGFRGFGFKRLDQVTGETIWLRGMKTFEETEPHPAKGEMFSTQDHPVQSFQWADYSVHPSRDYTYTIVALYGDPASLDLKIELEIPIKTEAETGPTHSAFFNRGSVASQEYARRFQNEQPSKAGPGAYDWLSRGLIEALVAFLGRAETGWSIHGAVYEFQWPAVLAAVRAAHLRGAAVKVLFDSVEAHNSNGSPKGPWKKNQAAIVEAQIKSLCKGRGNGKLMHNKFFVLSQNDQPKAVWTGSTNLTENGIFGHSNLGHIVEDGEVAQAFLDYWHRLAEDPKVDKSYRTDNMDASPAPPMPWNAETTAVFSPRGTGLDALEWYAQIAAGAQDGLFMTFAFGMHAKFKEVYRKDDTLLRMALLEKEGNLAQDKVDIQAIRNRPNVVLALGNRIKTNSFDRWLAELDKINPNVHVYWVHTKYMLVDPLGAMPTVVSGSANFSKASTDTNDENMLVIRGNKRIADIYFGEYMRLYTHYAFREAVKRYMEQESETPEAWRPNFLIDDDEWMTPYFDPTDSSARWARRVYFGGPMAV